jgi:hypothetical protein
MTEPPAPREPTPREPTQPGPVAEAQLRAGRALAQAHPEASRREGEAVQQGAAPGGAGARAPHEAREQRPERRLTVRQVTHVQGSWTEQERGAPGAFTLQLILDHGADEDVLRPTAQDAQVLLQLLERSERAVFDLERKVLIVGTLTLK